MSSATLLWIVAGWWLLLGIVAAWVFGSAARYGSCTLPRRTLPRFERACFYRTHCFNVLPALVVTPAHNATYDMEAGEPVPGQMIPRGLVIRRRTITLAIKWLLWHVGVRFAYGPVTHAPLEEYRMYDDPLARLRSAAKQRARGHLLLMSPWGFGK